MRALKAAIGVMSTLIVLGFGLMIWLVVQRSDGNPGFGETRVALPADARVAAMAGVGADRLVLRVERPGQPDRLMILDLARGRLVGTVDLARP